MKIDFTGQYEQVRAFITEPGSHNGPARSIVICNHLQTIANARAEKAEAALERVRQTLERRMQDYADMDACNDLTVEGKHAWIAFHVFCQQAGLRIIPAVPAQPLRVEMGGGDE